MRVTKTKAFLVLRAHGVPTSQARSLAGAMTNPATSKDLAAAVKGAAKLTGLTARVVDHDNGMTSASLTEDPDNWVKSVWFSAF